MDPTSGENPPDKTASFASAVSAALAHFSGSSKEGETKTQYDDSMQPPDDAVKHVQESSNVFAMYNSESSGDGHDDDDTKGDATVDDAESPFETKGSDDVENGTSEGTQDLEMAKEDYESSVGAEDDVPTAIRQLQAVLNEQTVNVKVKANNEMIAHDLDDERVDEHGTGIERSLSSSTNTTSDQGPVDMDEEVQEEHQHKHRTRSASFDIAQAMVTSTIENNNMDQETNTTSTSSFTNPPADFADASLLLGLTDITAQLSTKPVRGELEPAVLPSTMTFFLDMLNEDERRVRHRHIPAVEGFRKLYKNEIKQDLVAARALNKKTKRGADESLMEVDEEDNEDITSENDALQSDEEDPLPDSNAFVAPSENTIAFAHCGQLASLMESTPFENSIHGGVSATALRSPQLVESLTAFNPPRPQESTAMKTKHRLKRWESNPQDVEADLLNYKKTVQRCRMELHKAEDEHSQIEAVTSMIRTQYMNHLDAYREEITAVGEQLHGVRSKCFKAAEEHNGKTISTRGSSKTMKETFATLKNLGEEISAKSTRSEDGTRSFFPDWRVSGLGGIPASSESTDLVVESASPSLATGWILVGDKVKTPTGELGTVVKVYGPSLNALPSSEEKPKDSSEKAENDNVIDTDKPKEEADATLSKESSSLEDMVAPPGITVRFANETVKTFSPSELELQTNTFSCAKDSDIAKRWDSMVQSAVEVRSSHDYSSMNSQVIASILRRQHEEDNDGSTSPKSVAQYDDLRNVVPFGAGIMSAPEQIKSFSSIIPVNILEDNVRKVVYESAKDIQVILEAPPGVEKYEAQQEKLNRLKINVLQLRNRLVRQKKIRGLNELSLKEGKKRADKVEGLLAEMLTDLTSLKQRLQEELNELGIDKTTDSHVEGGENEGTISDNVTSNSNVTDDTSRLIEQSNKTDGTDASKTGSEKRSLDYEETPEGNKRIRVD